MSFVPAEPCANSTTIDQLVSLLHGLQALNQHLAAAEVEFAKLILQVLRCELEQLIGDCRANDVGSPYVSTLDCEDGVYTLRLKFPLASKE